MKSFIFGISLLLTVSLTADINVITVAQDDIRPSYPFPAFLSTSPYVWYEDVKNKPIKGHAYRIATFTDKQNYQIFIEKVEFGEGGCCLEIVDYRQILLTEYFFKTKFPKNTGKHGFKLIRWISPEVFEFEAYSGKYRLKNISADKPQLEEILTDSTIEK